ncbi:MAG: hypothetical protein Q9Q40_01680 [Acidobacteriota bacterium]|nr:hypothetical protein [Acidobacteriota bacterium]MDQ7086384.1 hypothetical protein [Acidobacteriota bacterium]
MKRSWKVMAALVLAGAVSLPWAAATERIRFKNGHTIVVLSSRVEGDFIYLTLEDGSEVGFPKALVAVQEEGEFQRYARPTNGFGGRGPSARETMAYRRSQVRAGHLSAGLSGVARKVKGRELNSVGFSFRGSGWGANEDASARPQPLSVLAPEARRTVASAGGGTPSGGAGTLPAVGTRRTRSPVKEPGIVPRLAPRLPRGKNKTVTNNGKF